MKTAEYRKTNAEYASLHGVATSTISNWKRKGWPLEGVEIDLNFERFAGKDYAAHEGDDRYVHEIRKAITLHGPLSDKQRDRIKEIGAKCPVHRLIATPSYFVDQAIAEEQAESEPSDS